MINNYKYSINDIIPWYIETFNLEDEIFDRYTRNSMFNLNDISLDMSQVYEDFGIYGADLKVSHADTTNKSFEFIGVLHVDYKFIYLLGHKYLKYGSNLEDNFLLIFKHSKKHSSSVEIVIDSVDEIDKYDKLYCMNSLIYFNTSLNLLNKDVDIISYKLKIEGRECNEISLSNYLNCMNCGVNLKYDVIAVNCYYLSNNDLKRLESVLSSNKNIGEKRLYIVVKNITQNIIHLLNLFEKIKKVNKNIVLVYTGKLSQEDYNDLSVYFDNIITDYVFSYY